MADETSFPTEDVEDPGLQEAPEEATEGSTPRYKRPRVHHTIESLRLDMEQAENGRPWFILPPDVRGIDRCGDTYPLPKELADLKRVAEVKIPGNKQRDMGCRYIYRARRAVKNRLTSISLAGAVGKLQEADEIVKDFRHKALKARSEMQEALKGVREAARETLVTMQDLGAEFKAGMMEIAKAYRSGGQLNGKEVTTSQFIDAAGKVFTHTRGMAQGVLDDATKGESEAEVMSELARASRERLKKAQGATTKVAEDGGTH